MAAGVIYQTVTTTSGETVELAFYVDDTITPTTWKHANIIINSSGTEASLLTTVAHDAVDAGDPLKIGGYASATAPSDVSAGADRVNAWFKLNGAQVVAHNVDHDGVDAGSPFKVGMRALAHGTNPTAVAAADRTDWLANRAGVPWVIGGHPNIVTRSHIVAASDGAQTDAALLTIATGLKIVITQISAKADAANSVNTAVKIGFGTATIPAASLAGTASIVLEGSFAGGSGQQVGSGSGIVAIGADNEDLRLTCGAPTGGNLRITYSYYTIES